MDRCFKEGLGYRAVDMDAGSTEILVRFSLAFIGSQYIRGAKLFIYDNAPQGEFFFNTGWVDSPENYLFWIC